MVYGAFSTVTYNIVTHGKLTIFTNNDPKSVMN